MPMSRVVYPIMPENRVRIDAGFLDPNYPVWRVKMGLRPDEHPGIDINLQGTSGNQDEGYPVVAIASGVVVHARKHRVWGNIVLVEHPELAEELGLPYLASQYAHMKFMSVREGDLVLAGEPVGSIGRGDPARPFLAHLHFEVRVAKMRADNWPGTDVEFIKTHYLDPEKFLLDHFQPSRKYVRRAILLDGDRTEVWQRALVNLDYQDKLYLKRLDRPER